MNGPPSFPTNLKKFAGIGRTVLADRVSATLMSLNRINAVDIPALLGKVISEGPYLGGPEAGAAIVELLDSRYEAEKAEGMSRLVALLSSGEDVTRFFPQVVKNMAVRSLHVKRLVYIYLAHYAQRRPEEALLSINTFQKELSDTNPFVRAQALRAMASVRLPAVTPIVVLAIQKCARDPHPHVRRCAAHSLLKLFSAQREQGGEEAEQLLLLLLGDRSPLVVGAAAAAFAAICPARLAALRPLFSPLCHVLPDADSWAQVAILHILLRYALGRWGRTGLGAGSGSEKDGGGDGGRGRRPWAPEEVRLLLVTSEGLLDSASCAVVLAATAVIWQMGKEEEVRRGVKALFFVLRSAPYCHQTVLTALLTMAHHRPHLLTQRIEEVYVKARDPPGVRRLKLHLLTSLARPPSIAAVMKEFETYVCDPDRAFVAASVCALGLCAVRLPVIAGAAMEVLLPLARRREAEVAVEAMSAIRSLVHSDPELHAAVLPRLVRSLPAIRTAAARATLVWMVGHFCCHSSPLTQVAPLLLRHLARGFGEEVADTKVQILSTAAKLAVHTGRSPGSEGEVVCVYLLDLARYDREYAVRDRARALRGLLSIKDSQGGGEEQRVLEEVAGHILSPHLPPPVLQEVMLTAAAFDLPSLSAVVGHRAPGWEEFWEAGTIGEEGEDSTGGSLRGEEEEEEGEGAESVEGDGSFYSTDYTHSGEEEEEEEEEEEAEQSAGNGMSSLFSLEAFLDGGGAAGEQKVQLLNRKQLALSRLAGQPKKHSLHLQGAGGLGLTAHYCFERAPPKHGTACVALTLFLRNGSAVALEGLAVHGAQLTAPQLPLALSPGQLAECGVEIEFGGRVEGVKVALECNGVVAEGEVVAEAGALLRPKVVREEVFAELERALGGGRAVQRRCTLGEFRLDARPGSESACVAPAQAALQRLLDAAHLSLTSAVTDSGWKGERWRLRLCGERVADAEACCVSVINVGGVEKRGAMWVEEVCVKVNCNDLVFGETLADELVGRLEAL